MVPGLLVFWMKSYVSTIPYDLASPCYDKAIKIRKGQEEMSDSEKLDLLLSKMNRVEEQMGRVEERMVTKEELCTKMRELENSILREVDTVQEKSNAHYEELKRQIIAVRDSFQARDMENIRTRLSVVESDVADLKRKVRFVCV